MTEKRKQYLKEWRAKNREGLLLYAKEYNLKYKQLKSSGTKTTGKPGIRVRSGQRTGRWLNDSLSNSQTRICAMCRVEKDIELFAKRRDKPLGRMYRCKACTNAVYNVNTKTKKQQARLTFKVAVRSGRVTKLPCQVCGDTNVHGHHTDYTKPLDVIWLCRKHHTAEHDKLKRNGIILPE